MDIQEKLETLAAQARWEKLLVAVIIAIYGLMCAFSPGTWRWLDGVNFLFHEAGHFFFTPFGRFMHFLGGTIGQLFFPVVCVIYFYLKKHYFSAFVVLFWVAQNMFNISVYAGDAAVTNLPILEGGIHDWNWMLTRLNMIRYTKLISGMIYLTGFVTLLVSIPGMVYFSFRDDEHEAEWEYVEPYVGYTPNIIDDDDFPPASR